MSRYIPHLSEEINTFRPNALSLRILKRELKRGYAPLSISSPSPEGEGSRGDGAVTTKQGVSQTREYRLEKRGAVCHNLDSGFCDCRVSSRSKK